MRLGLVKPTRREGTQRLQFVKRIPADLKLALTGRVLVVPIADNETVTVKIGAGTQSIRFSLKTSDVREAKSRQAEALLYVDSYLEALRSKRPIELSHRQIMALAGLFYQVHARGPDGTLNVDVESGEVQRLEDDYEAELMAGVAELLRERAEGGGEAYLHDTYGPVVDKLLARFNIPLITEDSRERLLKALAKATTDALGTAARYSLGDYRPDENLQKFPEWEEPAGTPKDLSGFVSLTTMVELWWDEAKVMGLSVDTYEHYKARIKRLVAFLGHDDARRVTHNDLLRYKADRLAAPNDATGKPTSPVTLATGEFVAFRSVFRWAFENGHIKSNPAAGLRIRRKATTKVREKEFTEGEASAILKAASELKLGRNPSENDIARRWVPWICAYSGCRVGEAVQLRKEDFAKRDGVWAMTITPEAGTVKTKEAREVPLHAHLIEQGLLDFVKRAKPGHLFITVKDGNTFRHTWRGRKNRVAEWVRTIVKDPNVAPNHAWRHSFKSRGFEAGIQEKILDAICGHAPKTTGRSYGTVTLKTKAEALKLFPRYTV